MSFHIMYVHDDSSTHWVENQYFNRSRALSKQVAHLLPYVKFRVAGLPIVDKSVQIIYNVAGSHPNRFRRQQFLDSYLITVKFLESTLAIR